MAISTLGVAALGVPALAGEPEYGIPTVTVTSPADGAVLTATSATVTWSYANSEPSATQTHFRVRLLTQAGTQLYDSGWTAGSSTASHDIVYALSSRSSYRIEVSVRSSQFVTATAEVSISVDLTVAPPDPIDQVGSIYEIGINGVGYMLLDDGPEGEQKYQRRVVSLDPPRLATSETPFNQAVERYTFSAQTDFTGGMGQRYASRANSVADAFWDSEGVWPFEPGKLTLLPAVVEATQVAIGASPAQLTVGAGYLWAIDNDVDKTLLQFDTFQDPTSSTSWTVAAMTNTRVKSLTSDGSKWYACDTLGIWRNSSAADPGAAWSTEDAHLLRWAGGRLCAGVSSGLGVPDIFKTINDAGTVEYTPLTLPAGWQITDIVGGGGYVWVAAKSNDRGAVYAWQVGSADAATIAWELPVGERPTQLLHYQGQLLVITSSNDATSLYRCPQEGAVITPFLAIDGADLNDGSLSGLTARGRFVFFGWTSMTAAVESGLGVLDLATGGYAKHLVSPTFEEAAGPVVWNDQLCFLGDGLAFEDTNTYVSEGWLKQSIFDGASALSKTFDELTVQSLLLAANESVALEYTLDRGESYTAVTGGTLSTAGLNGLVVPFGEVADSLGLKLVLGGDGTTTPTATMVQAKLHPLGMADQLVQLRVNCFDDVRNLQGGVIKGGPGAGVRRARLLEALTQTSVVFQDIDWHITGVDETYEVIQAATSKTAVFDRHQNKNTLGLVCQLTLRKAKA